MGSLRFDGFAIGPNGPTLTLDVGTGRRVAIVGPTRAGKSRALDMIAGVDKPGRGTVSGGTIELAGAAAPPARTRVGSFVRRDHELAVGLRLEGLTRAAVGELSDDERARLDLFSALVGRPDVLLADETFDHLDPWSLTQSWRTLQRALSQGAIVVYATRRPDLVARADVVIAFDREELRFAGTVDELLRLGPPHQLEISTNNPSAVRAITAPFEVKVTESGPTMALEAAEGREIAARLLRDGYGDVRFVVLREPTIEEALAALISTV